MQVAGGHAPQKKIKLKCQLNFVYKKYGRRDSNHTVSLNSPSYLVVYS